ncbi:uncharacterized protein LOC107879363 [Capsicum annuum]|uniref:uncharacterized protein LOC107879363 n=1 Tax=Capsicum annuum TaxID=4072 RepID=UPI001FB0969E|nr:uncharacterized protein LOC107879363 [Capsicum annuum]
MSLEKYFRKVSKISSTSQNQSRRDEDVDQIEIPSQSSQRQKFDVNDLKGDPAERPSILSYPPNIHDEIRRAYILKHPFQPQDHEFPQTDFFEIPHRFVSKWFDEYFDWLEYSAKAFIKVVVIHFSRRDLENIGPPNSIHNQSKRKCEDLMREEQSIEVVAFNKLDEKIKNEYRVRLNASIDVVQFLLNQGLALRGHDESESSLNKDIVTACKIKTIKAIIKDLDGDYFALLVDESRDVSCKEQMAICLRYVDKRGFVMETFIGLVHVKVTSALSLKKVIVDVLAHHSLTLAYVQGQCYDGASNMQSELGGLKILIKQESRSAHSVHCFAHQLQLTLVAVSKRRV